MTDAATPETATAPEVHDLASAARAIEKIIRRETAPDPNEGGKETPADDDDPENADEEAGADEEEIEHDPGVDDDDEEQAEDDGEPEEARYKVKVGGEETDVTLKELIKGYQRGADYTKKTMRLADERRSVERAKTDLEQERTAMALERAAHAERLNGRIPALKQQLAQFDGIDWNRLSGENPTLFAQAKPLFDSLSQQLQQAEAERQEHAERDRQRRLQATQAHQDYIAEQKRALIARHPEMADPAKGRQETAALTRYLIDTGYRQDELSRLVDHRDFILARKAMLYDRLMANRDKVKQTVAALPRVQKPGTARGSRTGAAERRAKLMTRLERTGRTEDAARLIEDML
jgi:hypothetical protein